MLNVGAGAGSYEPVDRVVVAAEPSAVMVAQRPAGAAPAVRARAEGLPFADGAFDAALAVLTVHHWADRAAGLAECARVARGRVVVLTWDAWAPAVDRFWLLHDYFPEFLAIDREEFPTVASIGGSLRAAFGPGAREEVVPVPIPRDCVDGFLGAFWARPAAYLDAAVRGGISSFACAEAAAGDEVARRLARLRADLASGAWQARHRALLSAESLDIGYRIIVVQGPHTGVPNGDAA